jgi:hypothetical protein
MKFEIILPGLIIVALAAFLGYKVGCGHKAGGPGAVV